MFGMFSVKKKDETPADVKIEEIKNILFPPLEMRHTTNEQTGEELKYHIDYSVDSNLESALADLEEGYNDKTTQNTIRDAANKIYKIRELLEAHMEISKEASYIVVDNNREELDIPEQDI